MRVKRDKTLLRIKHSKREKIKAEESLQAVGRRRSEKIRSWDREIKLFNCWKKKRDFKYPEAERILAPRVREN